MTMRDYNASIGNEQFSSSHIKLSTSILEATLKSTSATLASIVAFTSAIGGSANSEAEGYVERIPRAINTLKEQSIIWQAECDSIEQRLVRAIAILERDDRNAQESAVAAPDQSTSGLTDIPTSLAKSGETEFEMDSTLDDLFGESPTPPHDPSLLVSMDPSLSLPNINYNLIPEAGATQFSPTSTLTSLSSAEEAVTFSRVQVAALDTALLQPLSTALHAAGGENMAMELDGLEVQESSAMQELLRTLGNPA